MLDVRAEETGFGSVVSELVAQLVGRPSVLAVRATRKCACRILFVSCLSTRTVVSTVSALCVRVHREWVVGCGSFYAITAAREAQLGLDPQAAPEDK